MIYKFRCGPVTAAERDAHGGYEHRRLHLNSSLAKCKMLGSTWRARMGRKAMEGLKDIARFWQLLRVMLDSEGRSLCLHVDLLLKWRIRNLKQIGGKLR